MNIENLETQLAQLVSDIDRESFIYDMLLAYEQPKASITRLKKGDYNHSKNDGEILWKKKLFFKADTDSDLHSLIDKLQSDPGITRHHPRFIIVTDYQTFLSVDTKTKDTLDIPIQELPKHFDFFLPWAGMEKSHFQSENPADIKAAERMGRLYDIILEDNPTENDDERHALNIFLSRLLFCFFAEDTGIFFDDQFTNAVASHTADDGSDLQAYLQKLFTVLNLEKRSDYPKFLQDFPYVNGGLFADEHPSPVFSAKARRIIIECGALNWKAINPDIFGSMIQAVVHNDQRGSMGMHYTSVVNIMKVIEPLFLNDLYEVLEKAEGNEKKLAKLLDRLYHLKIFDPACGSGNFLIIAYKELCKLEIEVFRQLQELGNEWKTAKSGLRLTQFYGIELDDFAQETAKLSLWLAEHQMNLAFKEVFGDARPTLPLQDSGRIVFGNATRLDWGDICRNEKRYHVYVLGNPPYAGFKMQSESQKEDMKYIWGSASKLDYISCWFLKSCQYVLDNGAAVAFVATNSICQGEQISLLWPHLIKEDLEINFCHTSFIWTNNAKGNAGVTCVVIGITPQSRGKKVIYDNGVSRSIDYINAYLTAGKTPYIKKRSRPLSMLSIMTLGDMAKDGGHLILSTAEKNKILSEFPEANKFFRKLVGAQEFLQGGERWCLWIEESSLSSALEIPPIKTRANQVKAARLESKKKATREYSNLPYRFVEIRKQETESLLVPTVTSERREYIPIGFNESLDIINAPNQVIYSPPLYLFSIISSRMHMTWVRAVAGRLKTDYRYSSALCYNTFPFPEITEDQISTLEDHVLRVLDERENHPEKTMAEMYDPDKMPDELRQAHHEMDLAVEQCYRKRPFGSDEERLEYLFKLYEEMIEAEQA